MIIKEIPELDYNIAQTIYNECFDTNNKNINIPLLGNLLGLYNNNNLIGLMQIDYINNLMENKKQAIINSFCIKKEYQNLGYGNHFLNEVLKYLKDKKIDKIILTSNKTRIYAHKIYQKNNFKQINTIILGNDI